VLLVPNRFLSKTRCFFSNQEQHDYPWGVKLGSLDARSAELFRKLPTGPHCWLWLLLVDFHFRYGCYPRIQALFRRPRPLPSRLCVGCTEHNGDIFRWLFRACSGSSSCTFASKQLSPCQSYLHGNFFHSKGNLGLLKLVQMPPVRIECNCVRISSSGVYR
jgi:hypothetical protein